MKRLVSLYSAMTAAAVIVMANWTTESPQPAPLPAAQTSENDEGLIFYASMNLSDEWTSNGIPVMKYAIYSLSTYPGATFTACTQIGQAKIADAAIFLDGKYYCVDVPKDALWNKYTSTFSTYDTETWQLLDTKSFGNGNNTYAHDMTYDYSGAKAYAVSTKGYKTENPTVTTILKSVDLESGEMTTIGDNGCRLYSIAADATGDLWGVGVPLDLSSPTSLYTIDKATGKATKAADLDINLYYATSSSLTFDLRTGKLYLTGRTYTENADLERQWETALYEIDTTTGSTSVTARYDTNETLAGLVMKDCNPKAPQPVTGLEFIFDAGSTSSGKIRFSLPELTYDRNTLAGPLKAEIYIDGTGIGTIENLTPGSTYTSEQSHVLATGDSHRVKVICYKDGLKSLPSSIDVFSGNDTPAKPQGINVSSNSRGDQVTISWTAPTEGENGGYIDQSDLSYDVVLKPDNITIASGIRSTSTDYTFVDRRMGITQFQVTAKAGGLTSGTAASEILVLGSPWPVPYLEDFNYTAEELWPFTKIDANGDADEENGFQWYFGPSYKAAWYYTTPNYPHGNADDWLITPTIDLSSGNVYRIQFDTYGYMGGINDLQVTTGAEATVQAQDNMIYQHSYNTAGYSYSSPLNLNTLFIPRPGDCRIAFHNISDGSDHMFIDNIYVSYYGPSSIPGKATDMTAMKNGAKVDLSFKTPATTAAGDPLNSITSIKIYRTNADGELLATIDNPQPGSGQSLSDTNPNPGISTYMIIASNSDGAGLEATMSIDTNADIPRQIENLAITGRNGWTEAVLSWNYPSEMTGVNGKPIDESEIYYDIYRTIGITTVQIAQNAQGSSYIDSECSNSFSDGHRQEYVTYKVIPRTSGGEGEATTSKPTLMGQAYNLPFNESWTEQKVDNYPWISTNSSLYSNWSVASTGYDPLAQGQDGYGLASFSTSSTTSGGSAEYVSPRIDISDFAQPKLSFYLYRSNDTNTSASYLQIGFADEEQSSWLPDRYDVYSTTSGWQLYEIYIPDEFAHSNRMSVIFKGYSSNRKGSVHIDNVSISGQQPDHEVKASSIKGSEQCLIGNGNIYSVEVANIGRQEVTGITVELYADNDIIGSSTISAVAPGSTATENFIFTPSLDNRERQISLKAMITAAEDESSDNNEVETTVSLVAPMLPYVTDLSASSTSGTAQLSWSEASVYPHVEYITDDASSYEAFSIDNAGDWSFVDKDGQITTLIQANGSTLQWTNAGSPQAFIVFNPILAEAQSIIQPRTGDQCFISFAARNANDDWMISPQLSGEAQTIGFYAKCAHYNDLNEKFEVWTSSTTRDLDDFNRISGSEPVTVASSTQWSKFTYDLPLGTKYFAIRCVSVNQTGLMIDDITYSPAHDMLEIWGYNVYRDGEKITAEPVGDYSFTDSDVVTDTEYTYNVSAVYDAGESIFSNPAKVKISLSGASQISYDGAPEINALNGGICVRYAAGMAINVYAVDGRQLFSIVGTGNDLIPVEAGIYIVKAGNATAKVAVR